MLTPFELPTALVERDTNGLKRSRMCLNRLNSVMIEIDGEEKICFCSNDYLGLSQHPKVINAANSALMRYGVGSGSAQLIAGYQTPHREFENALAHFMGYPRALLFSSGYVANCAVLSTLLSKGKICFHDRRNHASLLDGAKLGGAKIKRYRDLERLAAQLTDGAWVVSETVFSMDGSNADLNALIKIANQHRAPVMLDDAHGFGVLGSFGRGALSHFKISPANVPVQVIPLGKAMGISGAMVVGNEILIESLLQFARPFIYTTALPPAIAAAGLASLELIETGQYQARLFDNLDYFKTHATKLPLRHSDTPIQAIMVGDPFRAKSLSDGLLKAGLLVRAIVPPTVPKHQSRLRITINADHTRQQMDSLLEHLFAGFT